MAAKAKRQRVIHRLGIRIRHQIERWMGDRWFKIFARAEPISTTKEFQRVITANPEWTFRRITVVELYDPGGHIPPDNPSPKDHGHETRHFKSRKLPIIVEVDKEITFPKEGNGKKDEPGSPIAGWERQHHTRQQWSSHHDLSEYYTNE